MADHGFRLGGVYERKEIHGVLGGSWTQMFARRPDGRIVCACIRLERHPDAPDVLLVTSNLRNIADQLVSQIGEPLPVFTQKSPGCGWRYLGNYAIDTVLTSGAVVAQLRRERGHGGIHAVVRMRPVPGAAAAGTGPGPRRAAGRCRR